MWYCRFHKCQGCSFFQDHAECILQTKDANGEFYVRFYFNDEHMGSVKNKFPATTFEDVEIKIRRRDGFQFVIKEFDYSGSDQLQPTL